MFFYRQAHNVTDFGRCFAVPNIKWFATLTLHVTDNGLAVADSQFHSALGTWRRASSSSEADAFAKNKQPQRQAVSGFQFQHDLRKLGVEAFKTIFCAKTPRADVGGHLAHDAFA